MTHRAPRFHPGTRSERYTQRGVESRRRGDRQQFRLRAQPTTTFRCNCGYSTTKADWLEECPICRTRFANDRSALSASRFTGTLNRKENR